MAGSFLARVSVTYDIEVGRDTEVSVQEALESIGMPQFENAVIAEILQINEVRYEIGEIRRVPDGEDRTRRAGRVAFGHGEQPRKPVPEPT